MQLFRGLERLISMEITIIGTLIYVVRGHRVMLDRDLARLYGVRTKALNQAVRRQAGRFPSDFMFQLTAVETQNWKSQIVTSNPSAKMGLRKPPHAFTEQGVAMLSIVLNPEADRLSDEGAARDLPCKPTRAKTMTPKKGREGIQECETLLNRREFRAITWGK